ncbi:energy transducer TonB [Caballeronia sordidicola]|uniref:energy transducer TonB n=1 Tax=Caballeronia sordidicola TaxID=196367 RepID=UPI002115F67F|nr:energy transducer TonB [Caballeronia sordidicola]
MTKSDPYLWGFEPVGAEGLRGTLALEANDQVVTNQAVTMLGCVVVVALLHLLAAEMLERQAGPPALPKLASVVVTLSRSVPPPPPPVPEKKSEPAKVPPMEQHVKKTMTRPAKPVHAKSPVEVPHDLPATKPTEQPTPPPLQQPAQALTKSVDDPGLKPAQSNNAATVASNAADRRVSGPDGFADYLKNPAPSYPAAARRLGYQGQTVLKVHVLASGSPDKVEIIQSSGYDMLDQSAVAAVKKWDFVPAKRGQAAIDGWVNVPLDFKLGG